MELHDTNSSAEIDPSPPTVGRADRSGGPDGPDSGLAEPESLIGENKAAETQATQNSLNESKAIQAILDVLRRGERFLVCSHSRPDGDAVGSRSEIDPSPPTEGRADRSGGPDGPDSGLAEPESLIGENKAAETQATQNSLNESKAIQAILDVLRRGERFLVCSHSRPDGDAVGS